MNGGMEIVERYVGNKNHLLFICPIAFGARASHNHKNEMVESILCSFLRLYSISLYFITTSVKSELVIKIFLSKLNFFLIFINK